jgi:hypothetical protein
VIQPAFSVLPIEHQYFGAYQGNAPDPHDNDPSVIENVPYEFAVPMLTGWELRYGGRPSDHHVREVGIWLDEIAYQLPAAAPAGTLSYKLSSVLRDDDNNASVTRHSVTVLGFRKIAANRTAKGPAPDLLPFNPSGAVPADLCRHEGSILKITIKNQGDAIAVPSRTTVTIEGKPFTLDTPAIPPAGAVDLRFKLLPTCLTTGCAFTVVADAQNQVAESNESNNSANGACRGR